MNTITINAYAKVNLAIDVLGKLPNGYHQVSMVMQQINLHDDVTVKWSAKEAAGIELSCDKPYLPTDERNLAYKAARLMAEEFGFSRRGKIRMDIKKRIPVGAGLAGGSGNGAAVLHGLNSLWELGLSLEELCGLGARLGSDVPFCIMGQARANGELPEAIKQDPMAASCALAEGTGTELTAIEGLDSEIVLCKPPISVSTAEVYGGLELAQIIERPDISELMQGLRENKIDKIQKNMINVLEIFTLNRYPIVVYTKNMMMEQCSPQKVIMSGSGPTIFAVFSNKKEAKECYTRLLAVNKETYLTRTTT